MECARPDRNMGRAMGHRLSARLARSRIQVSEDRRPKDRYIQTQWTGTLSNCLRRDAGQRLRRGQQSGCRRTVDEGGLSIGNAAGCDLCKLRKLDVHTMNRWIRSMVI